MQEIMEKLRKEGWKVTIEGMVIIATKEQEYIDEEEIDQLYDLEVEEYNMLWEIRPKNKKRIVIEVRFIPQGDDPDPLP